ncbi:MAG: polyribonucleotide nucleotidyltransferase, partial [Mucinivorans sp.]
MMYNETIKTIQLSGSRTIELSTGKLAKQADGAVVVRQGDTMLLATVTCAKDAKEDTDFMPLSVEYKEKYAANGRFPGGFLKREARPSDYEILISRLIDRALRPLFPSDFHAEVFVTVTLLSADPDIQPDALAGLAASAALAVSTVPFECPISEVRVARINGELVINPTFSQMENCDLDLMVAATMDNIMMVEGEMNEVQEEDMLEAIKFAHQAIKIQCQAQYDMADAVGSTAKRTYCHEDKDEDLRQAVIAATYDKAYAVAKAQMPKHERSDAFDAIEADYIAQLTAEEQVAKKKLVERYFHDDVLKMAMRNMILDEGVRLDGRKTNEIRPIWAEVGYLPAPHGSAIFTRGETQSLTTVTLGTKLDEKMIDDVLRDGS